jgi:hypothetical protein
VAVTTSGVVVHLRRTGTRDAHCGGNREEKITIEPRRVTCPECLAAMGRKDG